MTKYQREWHSVVCIPTVPTVPLNSIVPNPISNKMYLNPLDPDFYLDLYEIALTHRYQPSKYGSLLKRFILIKMDPTLLKRHPAMLKEV